MTSLARWLFALAGSMDSATGVMLLVAPTRTLGLMGIYSGPNDPALLRFVGAFVLGVGLCYFLAQLFPQPGRARAVAEQTALVRLVVGAYVAVAVALGSLPGPWVAVAVTDLTLAALQIWLVARGAFEVGESP